MEDAQDLNGRADQAVRYDERRFRDHEFTCARNSTGSSHFGAVGKQCLNVLNDVKRNPLRGRRIVLFNIGTERGEIIAARSSMASGDQTGVMSV